MVSLKTLGIYIHILDESNATQPNLHVEVIQGLHDTIF